MASADGENSMEPAESGYLVLARKYRPKRFEDLIGQEPMVQTLRNAFRLGRIAQAFMLTGVRGVGKTTTARILARALNFEPEAGGGAPTVELDSLGVHCKQIMEGRHVDVLEMDAASHNGVDDIREITDAARYAPVSARFKVYLLDEVHMLSKPAFNALLKTLEEPPAHVKFIFATTEINKVPITILSRCQRFDLRRIEQEQMSEHLRFVLRGEGLSAENEALRLVARASEGSVRDALSILDQIIAHAGVEKGGTISAEGLYDILSLADQATIISLFEAVMGGAVDPCLSILKDAYAKGIEPAAVIADLAEIVHAATRLKVAPTVPPDYLTQANSEHLSGLADKVSLGELSRAWQMLLKGMQEVRVAPRPLIAAEMLLIRVAYSAGLPTLDEALKKLDAEPPDRASSHGTSQAAEVSSKPVSALTAPSSAPAIGRALETKSAAPIVSALSPPTAMATEVVPKEALAPETTLAPTAPPEVAKPSIVLRDLEAMIALAENNGDITLPTLIRAYVRPVTFADKRLEIGLADGAPSTFVGDLSEALQKWTGERWMISLTSETDAQTLNELAKEREKAEQMDAARHPIVRAAMEAFPGARVTAVRKLETEDEQIGVPSDNSASDSPNTSDDNEEGPPWT
ncbi:MAG: DNA polymerase III subunit gamma/tau [Pseudomonadota bacterium]